MKLSRHARNNMRLYKISEGDILSAVDSPDGSAVEENRITAMKKFRDKFSGYPLKVVYEKIEGDIFILTAYPLKKKIWR